MIGIFESFEINHIHNGDAWKICNFIVANEDRLKHYFPKTLKQNLNPTLSQLFVDTKVEQIKNKEEYLFTLKHSSTRELVALIYLKDIDWKLKHGEIAYCIGYPFEGQGIITKAIKHISKYAFNDLDLNTLQIIVHKDNAPSVKVALNNDFIWQRTLENEFTPTGKQPIDMELYELYKN